ncbi:MAG TPA: dihydroorotase [Syntrophomonadaceae bacterium]|nr:dihydroorotase [Syntrophomonadaceae bacterium]HNX29137.1 dihydroorotase [Syntrophomonadaceae bacterium]HPR93690.1 dihydroorotase [Syntrophomonadaceae bacterium]
MKLLIKNGRVIDPMNGIDEQLDVLINNGLIAEIGKNLAAGKNERIIDAGRKIICPGFIDMHVHLRDPGYLYKEEIASGTRAAAAGGFTTICCMPNTKPVIDNAAVAAYVRQIAAKSGVVNVLPIGAITRNQKGEEITEMADLIAAGCIAVSDDGKPVEKAEIMRNALEYAKMFDLPVLSHCEDTSLSKDGQIHEGFYSTYYGYKGIPAAAEEIMAARDIILAKLTGGHIHICHVSSRGTVDMIRKAKAEGVNITCEVTPHHLTLTDKATGTYDANTKVNPPLRSQEHIKALMEGIVDGTIDCIATDHAPHALESKDCEYNFAAFGISGLETAVPLAMSLVNKKFTVNKMIHLFTAGPAGVLCLDKGSMGIGDTADLTILDPEKIKTVDPNRFYSKGKNTPFAGKKLKGWPYMTIVNGKIIAEDGRMIEE